MNWPNSSSVWMTTKCDIGRAGIDILPKNIHITLAMVALAFLTAVKVAGQTKGPKFQSKKPLSSVP